jgi:ankyrin repeat protein
MTQEPSQETINQFVGAAHGDFSSVRAVVDKYPSLVNARAIWNEKAIEAAAQAGKVEIAKYLLAHCAPLDICNASMLGQVDQVEILLQADPNLTDYENKTPLQRSVESKLDPIAALLRKNGARY